MSDYEGADRPSKRRHRDSASPSQVAERHDKDYRDTARSNSGPKSQERRRERSRSPDRDPTRRRDERMTSPKGRREKRDTDERRKRPRSHERDTDIGRRDHSHRRRDRHSSPKSDHHSRRREHEGGDGGRMQEKPRDRSRDRDRRHRRQRSISPKPYARSKAPLPSQADAFTSTANPDSALNKPIEKQKPNFGLTGKLAAASNTIQTANQTIVLKYHEPPEARKPPAKDQWRLYMFKEGEILDTVELFEQSCWLFGREAAVADFPIEHSSCSKQHAVIQFRYLEKRNEFGDKIGKVKPYVIDLESANGTLLNDNPVPAAKYVELKDKDVLMFGHSSREYVIQLPPKL